MSGERMQKVGRQFLIFPKWRIVVDPGTVDLTVNTADLNVTINGVSYATTDGNNYTAKLNHLYPGTYNFVASGKVNDQDITVSSEENVTSKTEVNLSVEYLSFTVKSNLKDGDLYVGGTKIGTLNSGKLDVNKVAVAGSSAVYVKKNFEDGSSIKTETLSIKKISEEIGKTPVQVNEAAGFVVNRILIPMINEAAFIKMEGVSDIAGIDAAMKLGANHPMGPLELGDFIGLDICLAIMDVLYKETGDSKYRACPLIRKMVRGGNLGAKSGKGFYVYNADRTKTPVDAQ